MVLVLFLGFFALSHLALLHSAGDDKPNCPPSFECKNLGSFQYPFYNTEDQRCGLCKLNFSGEVPTIQLEEKGPSYEIIRKTLLNTTIYPVFQELLNAHSCDAFNNISFPSFPSISFTIVNNITLFKCLNSLEIAPKTDDFFKNHSYDSDGECKPYTLYFKYWNDSVPLPTNPQRNCEVIQLPVLPPEAGYSSAKPSELFSVLAADFFLVICLSRSCPECHNKKGLCQIHNEGFQCADAEEGRRSKSLILGFAIAGSALILIILCLVISIIRRRYKWSYFSSYFLSKKSSGDLEDGSVYFGVPVFSYTELEEATNKFNPAKELGDGGFGAVYHGKLRDGREVAVKRLYEHNYKRVEQFMNEVKILTRIRHQNLVSLYGCTSHCSRELLLVYEYIPNGTVADHLHGDRAKHSSLTWPIRMTIAIETASALAYLHASDIIHRDVKTNNILLDDNFCVKVADFGLSRLFPNDVSHVSTAPQGTPGYVDPEYHQCYQLTDKSDVYSFGVVLIELISSMPAVDISRHRHEINLANLAINRIQRCAFKELIDPYLGFESDATVERMTTSVAELAFRCVQFDKEMRPTMNEVLDVLKEIQGGETKEANDSVGELKNVMPPHSPETEDVVLLNNTNTPSSPLCH